MARNINIMIVDDAMYMRAILRKILEGAGYNVVAEADDGESALKAFRLFLPDLVMMDINMPSISGLEAAKSIMKMKPDTKIIMVSAAGQKNNVIASVARGAKGFIVKPFHKEKILEVVENIFTGGGGEIDITEETDAQDETETSYEEIVTKFAANTDIETDEAEKMVNKFIDAAQKSILEIEQNIEENKIAETADAVHKLKGGFASYFMPFAADIMKNMEEMLEKEDKKTLKVFINKVNDELNKITLDGGSK